MKSKMALIMIVLAQAPFSRDPQTLNFSGKDVSLKEIFAVIKNQTGIVFFYDEALLKDVKPVTIEWENVTFEKALHEIFKDQPVTWVIEDKTATIIKRPGPITPPV